MTNSKQKTTETYFKLMHQHLKEVKEGKSKVHGLKYISEKMYIHPRHLSNTIKCVTGKSPCSFFEEELIKVSKELLQDAKYKISDVAFMLDYDPSNFTKFFKQYTGQTPSQYRLALYKTELFTTINLDE